MGHRCRYWYGSPRPLRGEIKLTMNCIWAESTDLEWSIALSTNSFREQCAREDDVHLSLSFAICHSSWPDQKRDDPMTRLEMVLLTCNWSWTNWITAFCGIVTYGIANKFLIIEIGIKRWFSRDTVVFLRMKNLLKWCKFNLVPGSEGTLNEEREPWPIKNSYSEESKIWCRFAHHDHEMYGAWSWNAKTSSWGVFDPPHQGHCNPKIRLWLILAELAISLSWDWTRPRSNCLLY